MNVNSKLKEYVEREIIPRYDNFDKAHQRNHVIEVIRQSMQLAQLYDVNVNMVYAIAAFHDTGLCRGREYHHIASAAILRDDKMIDELFSADEINIMAEAIEDNNTICIFDGKQKVLCNNFWILVLSCNSAHRFSWRNGFWCN
ncbi:MAG: HD domain-containing protein [Bacteroidaceae bacterium]|nr:HD domain-containing protein [Bacteroidaceae bacterium]